MKPKIMKMMSPTEFGDYRSMGASAERWQSMVYQVRNYAQTTAGAAESHVQMIKGRNEDRMQKIIKECASSEKTRQILSLLV